jgi:hypothetical protein
MAKRVVRSPKTTIRKTKKTTTMILKGVSEKAIRPAVGGGRLPVRERKTLLAIAKVLAGK